MGLQGAIESIAGTRGLDQQWFLDDGGLLANARTASQVFATLKASLLERGLRVNTGKCEVYCLGQPHLEGALATVPMESCRDKWSYLGSPLREQTLAAVNGTVRRIQAVNDGIKRLATGYPSQALQLLRASTGACRVEFLLQTMPHSPVVDQLIDLTEEGLRQGLADILMVDTLQEEAWKLATVPVRLGGLGLRAPSRVKYAARLASLVSVEQYALELTAVDASIDAQKARARKLYEKQLGQRISTELHKAKQDPSS